MFERMILMIFSILGLLNGSLFALIMRKRNFFRYTFGGFLMGLVSAGYFVWYAKGYDGLGTWSLWLGYLFCGLMVTQIVLFPPYIILPFLTIPKKWKKPVQKISYLVLLAALFIGIYGAIDGNRREVTEYLDVYVEGLPEAFDGYKAAQLTDTHIGPYFRYSDLPHEFDRAKAEGVQVVFFTGDLIDDVRHMPETAEILSEKYDEFADGIIYVWGNHEYYRGQAYIHGFLNQTPVKLLENEHLRLTRMGESIYVAGVDYPWVRGERSAAFQRQRKDMTEWAFEGIPRDAKVILLAHNSSFIDEGFARGAILTLTGHTHGTQFGLFGRPIITPFKFTRGLYTDGTHPGYVSRGSASWFPFRFSCPRELVIITLHRK